MQETIHGRNLAELRLHFFLLFFLFLHFSFCSLENQPLKPFPCMAIYRKRPFGIWEARPGKLELAQASWFLIVEGINSPRQAGARPGCLRLEVFHGPDQPNASLGELGSKNFQKNDHFAPFLVFFSPDLTIKHQFEQSLNLALQSVPNTIIQLVMIKTSKVDDKNIVHG